MKKLTVVISAFNMEKYLSNCIETVLNSTINDQIEIILVLGISNDNTNRIANNYSLKHQNITIYDSKRNDPAEMRNIGIHKCNTPYITFMDCDDTIHKSMYEVLLAKNTDLATCSYQITSEHGNSISNKIFINLHTERIKQPLLLLALGKINGEVWNKVYNTSIIKQNHILFNSTNGIYGEDLLFNWMYLLYCNSVYSTENILYNHTLQINSITQKKEKINFTNRIIYILNLLVDKINIYDKNQFENTAQIIVSQLIDNIIVSKQAIIDEKNTKLIVKKYELIPHFKKFIKIAFKSKNSSFKRKVLCACIYLKLYSLINTLVR